MTIRPFSVAPGGSVVFGVGVAAQVGQQGPLKKAQRVAVVTDAGVAAAGLLDRVLPSLGARAALVDDGAVPDGDVDHINALAARMREAGVDAILAVGGGSVIDTAKCVAAVMARNADIQRLEGFASIRARLLPVVAVPTTAGTGSEATQFAVVNDRAAGRKRIYADLSLVPAHSVLDPELIRGLPRAITAATGVDAITHAVEALGSTMRNPVASALAVEAVRLLVAEGALGRSLEHPEDLDARGACLTAAHLAGQAISSAMLGACHAFAHALGAFKGVPHGVANGVLLGPTMRLNLDKAAFAYARLGALLGVQGDARTQAEGAVELLEEVVHRVAGLPTRLRELGVAESDVDALVPLVMADADLATNPVVVDVHVARRVIAERW